MLKNRWPIALGLLALILWILYAILALSLASPEWIPGIFKLPAEDQTTTVLARRGQFGDAFGAFNALVSTFALIGLFFTIRSQQIQIEAQSAANASSEKLTRQQQFQEQYYRAIDAYRELLSNIEYSRDDESRTIVSGRVALWTMWRDQIIAPLNKAADDPFSKAIKLQTGAYANEALAGWNTNIGAVGAIRLMLDEFASNSELRAAAIARIGVAWSAVYNMHRFQLDSLFRSWYTAFRVLSTAESYGIPDQSVRLYSAVFRARLSWIEMAFLLLNQSALPGNPAFPRACFYSNKFVLFDNLDVDHDTVVALLHQLAAANPYINESESAVLCSNAFVQASSKNERSGT